MPGENSSGGTEDSITVDAFVPGEEAVHPTEASESGFQPLLGYGRKWVPREGCFNSGTLQDNKT